ncbi:MAG: hypothetical protein J6Y78_17825 [Paludibacteraceae bacterium]|nr:hypothetical protein [Paludibacteraceae bacterium]
MKIVIDILEEDYKRIKSEVQKFGGSYRDWEEEIANGTPLPAEHGRIGDLDAVMSDISTNLNEMTNLGFAVTCEYLWAKLNDVIYNAPTIIEGSDS